MSVLFYNLILEQRKGHYTSGLFAKTNSSNKLFYNAIQSEPNIIIIILKICDRLNIIHRLKSGSGPVTLKKKQVRTQAFFLNKSDLSF